MIGYRPVWLMAGAAAMLAFAAARASDRQGKLPVKLLILGDDALAGCSLIVFDKPSRQIRPSCGG